MVYIPPKDKKPRTRYSHGLLDKMGPPGINMPAARTMPGFSGMRNFASKMPFGGSISNTLFGGEENKPSNREMLMYHFGKVGALQARAESEQNPKKLAKLSKQIDKNKYATEKYAYKLDQKFRRGAQFLPPRTYDQIAAGRQAYVNSLTAAPNTPTRTIMRTL